MRGNIKFVILDSSPSSSMVINELGAQGMFCQTFWMPVLDELGAKDVQDAWVTYAAAHTDWVSNREPYQICLMLPFSRVCG